jgi:hypothetical protein
MFALRSLRRRARPERIRVSLGDTGAGLALPLQSRRTWIAGLGVGLAALVVASVAWQQMFRPRPPLADTIVGLALGVLRWCWIGGLWVGALVLGLLAVILLFYRESARLAEHQLIHVVRLGPVRVFLEYDLAGMRELRAAGMGPESARIRFDYGDREVGLGSDMPLAEAEARVKMIRSAIERLGARRPSQGGAPPPRPTPRP